MLAPEVVTKIGSYIAAGMAPRVESVLGDAHVFWWDVCEAEDAAFCIINRNGNISRAYQVNGVWGLVKGLGKSDPGPFYWDNWELTSHGYSIAELAQKCWLPDQETLSFLPKALTPPKSRRLLISRDLLFKFITNSTWEGFKLQAPGGQESALFRGKPWESRDAAEWARKWSDGGFGAPVSAEAALAQVAFVGVQEKAEAGLDGLWGMF
jgi:hypothetical protein